MNRNTRDALLSALLWAALCFLLLFVLVWCSGCSSLKAAAWTGGAGAVGAGIGFLAPPFGPVIGAGIAAMIGGMFAVNDALTKVAIQQGSPPAPWFLRTETWLALAAVYFVVRNREHFLAPLRAGKGQRLKTTARGLLHSVVGGKVGKPHTS